MDVQELRKGNYLQWDDESGDIVQITRLYLDDDSQEWMVEFKSGSAHLREFIPILLTHVWIIDFGFKYIGFQYILKPSYHLIGDEKRGFLVCRRRNVVATHI